MVLALLTFLDGLPGRTNSSRSPLSSRSVSFSLSLGVSVCAPTVRSLRVRLRLVDFNLRAEDDDVSRAMEAKAPPRVTERDLERDLERVRLALGDSIGSTGDAGNIRLFG